MTLPVVLAIAGCIALLIGLFGGEIEVQTLKNSQTISFAKSSASLIGLAFIGIAIWYSPAPSHFASQPTETVLPAELTSVSTPAASPSPAPSPTTQVTVEPIPTLHTLVPQQVKDVG